MTYICYQGNDREMEIKDSLDISDLERQGYKLDANGRWHRPNGQFASNAEMGIPTSTKTKTTYQVSTNDIIEVKLSRSKYPESAKHIENAIESGQPDVLTINRNGAKANRQESLRGIDKVPGNDLDEYPPAMFREGGQGADVRAISSSDNRGSGSSLGHQLRKYKDGTKVKTKIVD